MYTLWYRQYLLATQVGVELLSNCYWEWTKGFAQLTMVGLGLPVSDEPFEDAWIDNVPNMLELAPRAPRVGNCAASIYSRNGFSLARAADNDGNWIICIQGA